MSTVNEKLAAIADAIRDYSSINIPLSLDAMANSIRIVSQDGYNRGYWEGSAEDCRTKHYVGTVMGNDASTISLSLPFKPDIIQVYSYCGYASTSNAIRNVELDFQACGKYCGYILFNKADAYSNVSAHFPTEWVLRRVTYDEQSSTLTIPIRVDGYPDIKFKSNVLYNIIAIKTGKSQRESVMEEINNLPDESDGTTLQYNSVKINESFTTAEWESLIATKPNWSFSLI